MTVAEHLIDLAWLGDDFTGSAAVMEVLEFAGIPAVLFRDRPDAGMLARFPNVRALGIATTARSHSPDWMDQHLPNLFEALRDTGAPLIHYKVCTTLDSSPDVGSIGRAMDIGANIIGGDLIPCVLPAPRMRRYQTFGHLFAAAGEQVYRIDRHPVMARHPVTPIDESDVAAHLGRQTRRRFGLITVEDLESDPRLALIRAQQKGADTVLFDAMTDRHMATIGGLLSGPGQRFIVGSQGVEYALVGHLRAAGRLPAHDDTGSAGPVDQIVVMSGSVSPTTATQIDWAERNGYVILRLDPTLAIAPETRTTELDSLRETLANAQASGRDVLICSARGPNDPTVHHLQAAIEASGADPTEVNARIGALLGALLKDCLARGLRRAVLSGGDSSGHALRTLDLFAFTALSPTVPGAPLLRAHSFDPTLDGIELALKGGQMGSQDYFGWIKRGGGVAQNGE